MYLRCDGSILILSAPLFSALTCNSSNVSYRIAVYCVIREPTYWPTNNNFYAIIIIWSMTFLFKKVNNMFYHNNCNLYVYWNRRKKLQLKHWHNLNLMLFFLYFDVLFCSPIHMYLSTYSLAYRPVVPTLNSLRYINFYFVTCLLFHVLFFYVFFSIPIYIPSIYTTLLYTLYNEYL